MADHSRIMLFTLLETSVYSLQSIIDEYDGASSSKPLTGTPINNGKHQNHTPYILCDTDV